MQSLAEIEAEIVRDPDDLDLRRVYADALQERDHPRGEHLSLSALAETGDRTAGRKVRAIERAAAARMTKKLDKDYVVRLRWKHGFVEHVDVDTRSYSDKFPRTKLKALLDEPELLAVRSFDLRGIWNTDWNAPRMIESLPELFAGRPIRWLGIGDGPIEASHLLGLRTAMPRLDGLGVVTTKPRQALAGLRGLVDIEFASRELNANKLVTAALQELREEAGGPALRRLVFHGMGDRIAAAKFEPLLSGEVFPGLVEFGVFGGHELTWDLWRRLAEQSGGHCALRSRLTAFGFCAADLWDDEASEEWIKAHGKALAHAALFTSAEWPDEDNGHESGRLGQILKAIDREADAIPEIEHHLQFSGDDSDHFGCWEELGEAMVWAGRAEEALPVLERGIAAFTDQITDDSIFTYRTKIEALCFKLERHEEALQIIDRTLAYQPDHSWTQRARCVALRELGRYDESVAAGRRAIECAPRDEDPAVLAWAHLELARTLWDQRKHDEALAEYAEVRKLTDVPASSAAHWDEGTIAYQRGDTAAARASFETAIALTPEDDDNPYDELGEAWFELGEYQKAYEVWRRAAERLSSWREVDEQGYALLALGRPGDALAAVEGARSELGGARAIILHALGRTEEAIAAVEGYAHRPGLHEPVCVYRHVVGRLMQGVLLRAAGREDEARPAFADARRSPHDPRELHALIATELGGVGGQSIEDLSDECDCDLCGRAAAVVGIAASLALGDRDDALARARTLGAIVDAGPARLFPDVLREVRAIQPLLGSDPLIATARDVVERCADGHLLGD